MSYNTRNSGRGMYSPAGGRHMGQRPLMGRAPIRMSPMGRGQVRPTQNSPQTQSQPQPQTQTQPQAPQQPATQLPETPSQQPPTQSQPAVTPDPTPAPAQAKPPVVSEPSKPQQQPQLKASEGETAQQNNESMPPLDPTMYTQPAYMTQPGYTTHQQAPPKQTVVQGAPSSHQQMDQHLPQTVEKEQQQHQEPYQPENPITSSCKEENQDVEIMDDGDATSGDKESLGKDGKKKFNRQWYRKGPGFNVRLSKKIRKRRQNARLRHILCPKNAMMVLHELHPELKIVATEQLNAANQMVYTVEIEIEGKTYRGHGMSKLLAKQAGCENALKAVLLEKMAKSNVKVETEPIKVEEDSPGNNGSSMTSLNSNEEVMEVEPSDARPPRKNQAEDDVPWGSLASFALYKLFSEWQAQGYQLPVAATTNMMLPAVPAQKATGFQMAPMKKIPEDANKKHPVQLLNQLRPGSQYSEKREGNPPNLTFTFTVVVDGQTYEGIGSNKKDAKKECAKSALIAMGVKYD